MSIRDVIETELHPENMTAEDGLSLNRPWKTLILTLKEQKKVASKDK
jgi:hypothetical protein